MRAVCAESGPPQTTERYWQRLLRHWNEQQFCARPHGAPAAPQLCAAHRPALHCPEQHWLCIVQTAFA